jgi:hypothetical protein
MESCSQITVVYQAIVVGAGGQCALVVLCDADLVQVVDALRQISKMPDKTCVCAD